MEQQHETERSNIGACELRTVIAPLCDEIFASSETQSPHRTVKKRRRVRRRVRQVFTVSVRGTADGCTHSFTNEDIIGVLAFIAFIVFTQRHTRGFIQVRQKVR